MDMQEIMPFSLRFVKLEKHLLLPTVTSIVLTQNLYDILFQYLITQEQEEKLKYFINLLEKHIKSKSLAPFSMPLSELEFLGEGVNELRFLYWMEALVAVFEVETEGQNENEMESVYNIISNMCTYNRVENTNLIYVYPLSLTKY
ncbi:MAG: hypothetical protein ACOXZ5_10050 [Syntrophomonadaceae bacterium]|jgi:hypothetical protein